MKEIIKIDGLKYTVYPNDVYVKFGKIFVSMDHEGYDYDKMPKKSGSDIVELIENMDDDCVVIIARKKK